MQSIIFGIFNWELIFKECYKKSKDSLFFLLNEKKKQVKIYIF